MISLILTAMLGLFCCSSVTYNTVDDAKEIEAHDYLPKEYYDDPNYPGYLYFGRGDIVGLPFLNSIISQQYWLDDGETELPGYQSPMPYNNYAWFKAFYNRVNYASLIECFSINAAANNNLTWIRSANCYYFEKTARQDMRYLTYTFGFGNTTGYFAQDERSNYTPYVTIDFKVFYGIGGENDLILSNVNYTINYNFGVDSNFLMFRVNKPVGDSYVNDSLYTWLTEQDSNNFVDSYGDGYADGKTDGYNDGYEVGKQDGIQEAIDGGALDPVTLTIFTGILEIGLLPVNFFLQILNFNLFGINVAGFVSSLLTISIVIIIVRFCLGGKSND